MSDAETQIIRLLDDISSLEETSNIKKVITYIETSGDSLKKYFLEHIEESQSRAYDIIIDSLFKLLIDNPRKTSINDLLLKLLSIDPLPEHQYKNRISNDIQPYGLSESIAENYNTLQGENKNIDDLFVKLLSHGYMPRVLTQFDTETAHKYRYRQSIYNSTRIRLKLSEAPVHKKTIEDEQIQKLEDMYNDVCGNREDETDTVTNTHDLNPDADIVIFIINNTHYCYQKRLILHSLYEADNANYSNIYHKWIKKDDAVEWNSPNERNNPYFTLDVFDEGYGGKNGQTTYVQLPVGPTAKMLFTTQSIITLLNSCFLPITNMIATKQVSETPFTNVFNVNIAMNTERIGQHTTTFGVGQTHGQNDKVVIYSLDPIYESEDDDIQSFITYYTENIILLLGKLKDEQSIDDENNTLYTSELITNIIAIYTKMGVTDGIMNDETKASYMTIFSDAAFLKTIPKNSPKFYKNSHVEINVSEILSSLTAIVRFVYRKDDVPEDQIVSWIYILTATNAPNTIENHFIVTDETVMKALLEPDNSALFNGDDVSIADTEEWAETFIGDDDDNESQEVNPQVNLFGNDGDDEDYIPFGHDSDDEEEYRLNPWRNNVSHVRPNLPLPEEDEDEEEEGNVGFGGSKKRKQPKSRKPQKPKTHANKKTTRKRNK